MNSKFFKLLCIVLSLFAVLNFVACDSSSESEKEQEKKIEKLEKEIKKLKQNENDSDEALSDKSKQQKKKSKEHYVIATDIGFSPFEFEDEDGNIVGIDMDIIEAIAKDQGFSYEIAYVGWDSAIAACQAGQAEGMIAAASITQERKDNGWIFSDGYFDATQGMAVKKGSSISKLEDLNGKTVVVKNGTQSNTYVDSIKDKYGFKVTTVLTSPEMYQAVIGGEADACFDDTSILKYNIKSGGLYMQFVEGTESEPVQYGMAIFDSKNQELVDKFNAGLKNIKDNGKYAEIMKKYLG